MEAWKAIGSSIIGHAHILNSKTCEDALQYAVVPNGHGQEVLVCCGSDGAGSARYAGFAALYCTQQVVASLAEYAKEGSLIDEATVFTILETIYDSLAKQALLKEVAIQEYSCTLLGCFITPSRAVFFQIGDGAIVRTSSDGYYIPVWMPHNGEYQNTTSFVVDDRLLPNLKICILDEPVQEVALFSDGLQMLALNMDTAQVHQPFFKPLFPHLRAADDAEKISVLQRKLSAYLDSDQINERTDDDKTLFLATRVVT